MTSRSRQPFQQPISNQNFSPQLPTVCRPIADCLPKWSKFQLNYTDYRKYFTFWNLISKHLHNRRLVADCLAWRDIIFWLPSKEIPTFLRPYVFMNTCWNFFWNEGDTEMKPSNLLTSIGYTASPAGILIPKLLGDHQQPFADHRKPPGKRVVVGGRREVVDVILWQPVTDHRQTFADLRQPPATTPKIVVVRGRRLVVAIVWPSL